MINVCPPERKFPVGNQNQIWHFLQIFLPHLHSVYKNCSLHPRNCTFQNLFAGEFCNVMQSPCNTSLHWQVLACGYTSLTLSWCSHLGQIPCTQEHDYSVNSEQIKAGRLFSLSVSVWKTRWLHCDKDLLHTWCSDMHWQVYALGIWAILWLLTCVTFVRFWAHS